MQSPNSPFQLNSRFNSINSGTLINMPSPSTPALSSISVVPASSDAFLARMEELIRIHLRAMGYSESTRNQRTHLWRNSATNPGFTCALAIQHPSNQAARAEDLSQTAVGVAYGFTGDTHSWWYSQVYRGLRQQGATPTEATQALSNYAELAEIHVDPDYQGFGLGHLLLDYLLTHLPHTKILLSTPEVPREDNSAWRLYRHAGFTDVLRNFTFPADPRPFGILEWTAPN